MILWCKKLLHHLITYISPHHPRCNLLTFLTNELWTQQLQVKSINHKSNLCEMPTVKWSVLFVDLDEFVYGLCARVCERPICLGCVFSLYKPFIHIHLIIFALHYVNHTYTRNKTSSNSQACDRKSKALNSLMANGWLKKKTTESARKNNHADSIRFFSLLS